MHLTHSNLSVNTIRYFLHSTAGTTTVLFKTIAFKVDIRRDHHACS